MFYFFFWLIFGDDETNAQWVHAYKHKGWAVNKPLTSILPFPVQWLSASQREGKLVAANLLYWAKIHPTHPLTSLSRSTQGWRVATQLFSFSSQPFWNQCKPTVSCWSRGYSFYRCFFFCLLMILIFSIVLLFSHSVFHPCSGNSL